ncbi:4-coumarate--CoA ligase 1 [Lingula anatina]|uniref:Luciferin 4-monooxygenase n=1 Tax=Lingula anatina TaxID=7574 RepID=A0A1S3K5M5_LINAN|nr:4-coumarate--CoA ligase 1 [Lingula anatina]|eukprot:XP_013417930.1 4-coumarate--CoA ligase 1 [Lingula anatina]
MGIRSRLPDVTIPDVDLAKFVLDKIDQYEESVALVDSQSGAKYTFGDVRDHVRRIGSALTRLGFKKGDVFCVYSPNVPEFALILLGVLAVGGTVTTANPQYTKDELSKQMKITPVKYMVTVPESSQKALQAAAENDIKSVFVFGHAPGCKPFHDLLRDDGHAFPHDVIISPQDVALLPFSSGTTGLPKAVMLTHHNIVGNLMQMREFLYAGRPGVDGFLGFLPFFHLFGLAIILIGALKFRLKVVCMKKFDFEEFLACIETHKIRYLFVVPPIAILLAKHPLVDRYDLSSLETIMSAAAPLGKDIEQKVEARLKTCSVTQGYGLTETSPACSLPPLDRKARRSGSSGILVANTECKVVDPQTGKELGPNQDGELWFRGSHIFKGYLNNPEATAAAIDSDRWFHSGDIGHYDDDQYIYVIDRIKEFIKYKGFQVAPAELEGLLVTHSAVADTAVVGRPDEDAGELPMAFIVLKPGHTATETEIMDFLAAKVAPFKRLRGGVEIVQEIPKTASGKILRRVLREKLRQRAQGSMKSKL